VELILNGSLPFLTFFPLIGIPVLIYLYLTQPSAYKTARIVTIVIMVTEFLVSLPLFVNFEVGNPGMQFETNVPWIPSLGISFHLGIDGISLFLVLLTTFMMPITALWRRTGSASPISSMHWTRAGTESGQPISPRASAAR